MDFSKGSERLGNLSFSIDFDQYLLLARSGFWWKKFEQKWPIPSHSVFQLSEHFAQDWPLGFAKNDVPEMAIAFKVLIGTAQPRHPHCQLIGMVEVRWGEVTVRRLESQRDEGQPEFRDVQDFLCGQRFHDRTPVRADNERAFFFQGEERLADRRPAHFEFLRQFGLS